MITLLFLLIAAMFVFGEFIARGFLGYPHICSILRSASFLGISSIGQTIVILTSGFDLSIGPLVTMGNVFTCMLINGANSNTLWGLAVVIALGTLFGLFSGLGVTYLKIPPLVMTLAVGSLVTGVTLTYSHGAPKGLASPILRHIGVGSLFGVFPNIILIWILLSALCILLLRSTTFGRQVYYAGADEKVAVLSGVRVNSIKILAYVISGACSTLAGALMAGYTQTAFLGIGNIYTLWSIAAVVIGGTALTGGNGGYPGTIAGAIIMILLESVLTVMRMPEPARRIGNGLIILILIIIYHLNERRST